MRKFISLILIFSIAGHASVCNLYTIKEKVFEQARIIRRVSIPYHLKVLKHEISGAPFHEIIGDYLSKGVAQGAINGKMLDLFFDKLKSSRYVQRDLLQSGILDEMRIGLEDYKTGYELFRKNLKEIVTKESFNARVRRQISRNIEYLEKLNHIDAAKISEILKKTNLTSKNDVDIFFNLILIMDTYWTKDRRFYLDNFNEIFEAIRTGNSENLGRKQYKAFKRYKDIESKSYNFKRRRQAYHEDAVRADKEFREFRKLRTMCRTKKLNTLGSSHKRLFKWFSYVGTVLAIFVGFKISGNWSKEEGKKKFLMETVLSLISMWVGAKATASDELSNSMKALIWYVKGYIYNYADSETYAALFDKSVGNPMLLDEKRLQSVISELSKDKDIAEIFRRIDSAKDPQKEAKLILEENRIIVEGTEVSTDVLDLVIEGMSERVAYEKGRENNPIKTGTEAGDRLVFNNYFTAIGNAIAFGISIVIYRTFCRGLTFGPHTVGGALKPLQAIAIASGIMLIHKILNAGAYYPLRNWAIGPKEEEEVIEED